MRSPRELAERARQRAERAAKRAEAARARAEGLSQASRARDEGDDGRTLRAVEPPDEKREHRT